MRVLARDSLCPAHAEGPCVFGTGQVSHTSELVLAPGHTLRLENELHPSYCCVLFFFRCPGTLLNHSLGLRIGVRIIGKAACFLIFRTDGPSNWVTGLFPSVQCQRSSRSKLFWAPKAVASFVII